MSDRSAIEWTDATWNPTTGCTKISPGCAHCYIEHTPAFRIHGRTFVKGDIPLQLHADRLEQPLRWRQPRRIFVNSLSDLFHDDVPDAFIDRVFAVMALARRHTFQVLTKRPERMCAYLSALTVERLIDCCNRNAHGEPHAPGAYNLASINGRSTKQRFAMGEKSAYAPLSHPPLPNVWLGVTVENRRWKCRLEDLRKTPAALRFASFEPLLEDLGELDLRGIGWAILGAESGPGARDCHVAWIESIVAQCGAASVACFVKQLGRQPRVRADVYLNLRHRKGADPAEWPENLRVREWPTL